MNLPPYVPFLGQPISLYTLSIGVACLCAFALILWRSPAREKLMTVLLVALIGALIVGRLYYVLIHLEYYVDQLAEVVDIRAGGSNWHGAVIGAVFTGNLVALRRKIPLKVMWRAFSIALPIVTIGVAVGCLGAVCAYGQEVDTLAHHSSLFVSESRDIYGIIAPRYHTQLFIFALGVLCLLGSGFSGRWQDQRQFGIPLLMMSVGMFIIGFFRGDAVTMIANLRIDQLLDGWMILLSIILILRALKSASSVRS